MDVMTSAGLVLLFVFGFLGAGFWIFAGLFIVGLAVLALQLGMPLNRIGAIVKGTFWSSANSWEVAAVPMFVWMGELIFRTDISRRLFRGLEPWVDLLPGRLLHANVAGSTLFAAVCGSSTATTATIGKITLRALRDRNYDNDLAVGSLCGAGALGIMIPPSIVMIIYGVLTDVSIARLFAAGVFPGLLAAGLYSGYIMVRCIANPRLAPTPERRFTWSDRFGAMIDLAPILALMVIVLGGIYTGIATPSEAAAVGLATTFVIIIVLRQFDLKVVVDSLHGTVCLTSMIMTIVVAAAFLSASIAYLHLPQELSAYFSRLKIGPYTLILLVAVFYVVIGLALEGVSIFVTTLPIMFPLVVGAGFDPVWFGVFLVIMVELGTVSPPVGFNLFIIQGLTGQSMARVSWAALPFALLLTLSAVLLVAFPSIALWLPHVLFDR